MSARNTYLIDLVERVAREDQDALAELCRRTRPALAAFVRRIIRDVWVAEEVLQDVYLHVWRNASAYCSDRGEPEAWIYMIARSRALDSLRRSRGNSVLRTLDDELRRIASHDGEKEQMRRRQAALVWKTFQTLPPAQRDMVRLAFYEGYSHTEIADETGLPLGTVKGRIRIALNRMKQVLPAEMNPEAAGSAMRDVALAVA